MTMRSQDPDVAPSGGLRAAQREFTRRRFVDAAAAVFAEKGYVETTVDDILRRAGASKATFYVYYDNKASLLVDSLVPFRDEYGLLVKRFQDFVDPSFDDFECWIASYVDLYSEHRLLLGAMHQAEVVEPEFRGRTLEAARGYIEMWDNLKVLETGDQPRQQIELRCVLAFAQIQRFMYLWQVEGLDIDRRSAIHELTTAWYGVVKGPRVSVPPVSTGLPS
jgi:AcrR family transcriptional regulator